MANWTVSDELDARLREWLGVSDPSAFVEGLITDQLNYDEDPAYRAEVDAQMDGSEADISAGRVTDARQAMTELAAEHGIQIKQ